MKARLADGWTENQIQLWGFDRVRASRPNRSGWFAWCHGLDRNERMMLDCKGTEQRDARCYEQHNCERYPSFRIGQHLPSKSLPRSKREDAQSSHGGRN
jgi:hypothetical protein